MNCELCGFTDKKFFEVDIEGSRMVVCGECAKSGKIVREISEEPQTAAKPAVETSFIIDYEKILSAAAAEKHMTVREIADKLKESFSTLEKVFSGKILPSEELSKKLEKLLNVKLFESIIYKQKSKTKNTDLTIGDIVDIKHKQR